MLTPEQCRAARALLDWSQQELARRSGASWSTIKGFENGWHALMRANEAVIRAALEAGGVAFVEASDGLGPGVRLCAMNGRPASPDQAGPKARATSVARTGAVRKARPSN